MNGNPTPLQADEVKHIRTELQKIRNQVNQLIDQLEPRPAVSGTRIENEKSMILNLFIFDKINTENVILKRSFLKIKL